MSERTVTVGLVGKPHGVRGAVYVHPDEDVDEAFDAGTELAAVQGATALSVQVAEAWVHSGRRLVRFEGVTDRDGAEALRGARLERTAREDDLDADAHWADEILGRDVVTAAGETVGVVEALADGPAHDYLVVARPDGGELLVPAVEEFVEFSGDRVVVTPIPGLLDDEGAS